MWIKRWTLIITAFYTNPRVRMAALTIYYLAILLGLILMYGRGNFSTPEFIYQGF
jgi:D-Ala-teichoic acid biosynthesis protein